MDFLHDIGTILTKPHGLKILFEIGENTKDKAGFSSSLLRVACKFGRLLELQNIAVSSVMKNTEEQELLFRTDGFATALLITLCKDIIEDSLSDFLTDIIEKTPIDIIKKANNIFLSRFNNSGNNIKTIVTTKNKKKRKKKKEKKKYFENDDDDDDDEDENDHNNNDEDENDHNNNISKDSYKHISEWIKKLFFGLCDLVKGSCLAPLCRIVFSKTNETFDLHHTHSGVVGLIFLCTLCPSIVSSKKFTTVDSPTRSLLILSSKLIQKIVNHTKYDLLQPHLLPFNEHLLCLPEILEYKDDFFDSISAIICSANALHDLKKYESTLSSRWTLNDTRECWQTLLLCPREKLSTFSLSCALEMLSSPSIQELHLENDENQTPLPEYSFGALLHPKTKSNRRISLPRFAGAEIKKISSSRKTRSSPNVFTEEEEGEDEKKKLIKLNHSFRNSTIITTSTSTTPPLLKHKSIEDIGEWLETIHMGKYRNRFKEECIDGSVLMELNDMDLLQLDVHTVGDRLRIKRGIRALMRN